MSTQEEIFSTILPNVLIDKISIYNPNSSKDIKVTLSLLVKETLDNDLYGAWFDSVDIKKYINIYVVQSLDPKCTESLSLASDMIELVTKSSSIRPSDPRFKAFAVNCNLQSINKVYDLMKQKLSFKKISISKDTNASNVDIANFNSYDSEDGKKIYDIPYSITFDINHRKEGEIEHLSYFILTSLDIEALSRDFKIDFDVIESFEETSNIISEIVIDNSQVAGYTHIYTTPDEKPWTGPMHQDAEDNWRTGIDETLDSKPLTKVKIINNKIEDFRNVEEITKRIFDFSKIERLFQTSNITKIRSFDITNPDDSQNYSSEMMLARSEDDRVKFSFSLDFYKIMKTNSPYADYFKSFNERFKKEAIAETKIRSIKILRRRVKNIIKPSNKSATINPEPYDNNDIIETVAMSRDIGWKNFKNTLNLREIDYESESDYENIRFFTGVDSKITKITDGIYQYGIELEIEDGTLDFIKQKMKSLNSAKNSLLLYYNEATTPSIKKYYAENSNPHVESNMEYAGSSSTLSENYDPISNKFTRQFISKLNNRYNNRNRIRTPWVSSTSIFVNILDIFSESIKTQADRSYVSRIILSYLKPESANPSSIMKVIELFDYLLSSISKAAGISIYSLNSNNTDMRGSLQMSNSNLRNFKIHKFFKEIYDVDVNKFFGIDIMSDTVSSPRNSDGLAKFDINAYVNRMRIETLKFFKNDNPNVNIPSYTFSDKVTNTSYSYVTPSRIDLPYLSLGLNRYLRNNNQINRQIEFLEEGNGSSQQKALDLQIALLNFKHQIFSKNGNSRRRTRQVSRRTNFRNIAQNRLLEKEKNNIKKLKNSISELMGIDIEPIDLEEETVTDNAFNLRILPRRNARRFTDFRDRAEILSDLNNSEKDIDDEIDNDSDNSSLRNFFSAMSLPLIKNQKSKMKFNPSNERNSSRHNIRGNIGPVNGMMTNLSNLNRFHSNIILTSTNRNVANNNAFNQTRLNINTFSQNISNINTLSSNQSNFTDLPNQIKALLSRTADVREEKLISFQNDTFEKNIVNSPINILDFEMIMRIEYLDGYERNAFTNEVMINKPIWKLMNILDFNKFNSGKEVICRLSSYSNKGLNVSKNDDLESSIYDKYFILQTVRRVVNSPRNIPLNGLIRNSFETIRNNFTNLRMRPGNIIPNNIREPFTSIIEVSGIREDQRQSVINPIPYPDMTIRDIVNSDVSRMSNRAVQSKNNIPSSAQIAVDVLALDVMSGSSHTSIKNSNPVPAVRLKSVAYNFSRNRRNRSLDSGTARVSRGI